MGISAYRLNERPLGFELDGYTTASMPLKISGTLALAHIDAGKVELISRNGKRLPWLRRSFRMDS